MLLTSGVGFCSINDAENVACLRISVVSVGDPLFEGSSTITVSAVAALQIPQTATSQNVTGS